MFFINTSNYFWIWLTFIAACLYRIDIPYHVRRIYFAEKLPGPIALPIIGNAYLFLNKPLTDVFKVCYSWLPDYGTLLRVWLGESLYVFISHPIEAEALLSSSKFLNKSNMYDYLHCWLKNGLLTSKAKQWHQRRKIITPAFHFKILEQYIDVFDKQSKIMMDILTKYGPTDNVDLRKYVGLYTLDVICETAMGTCINAQINEFQDYVTNVKKITGLMQARAFSFLLRYDIFYYFSSMRHETNECLRILHGFTDGLIRNRRQQLKTSEISEPYMPDESEIGAKRKYNFVDIMLHALVDGKPLTNLEIREEVDTFIFEGHDTTMSAITFALYSIAKFADVQQKCVDEIRATIGDDSRTPITMGMLNSLPYMDLVIKETLRMYPAVPVIGRKIEHEVTINNRTYPADTNAMIAIIFLGRHPELHPKPMEFRPERFNEPQIYTGKAKSFAYIPFSAGSRNCIGQKFAELEMKAILTKMLRCYELSLHPNSVPEPEILTELVLCPSTSIQFHLKQRVFS